MKVKLTKITRINTNKEGEPYISKKTGKPFTICRIWTEEHGDKSIGGFDNQTTSNWKEGDEVEIIVKENGQWLNFEMTSDKVTRKEFDALALRVELIEKFNSVGQFDKAENTKEEDGDDLPF